jgi:hypothetical protein
MVKKRAGRFRIESISSDVPGLHVVATPSGEGEVFRVEVTPRPESMARGAINGTIRIATSDSAFPVITIPVHGEVK